MNKPDFYRYNAIFTYESDGVHIVFPDLPGCVTFGIDEEEAIRMAAEALSLHIYAMECDGDDIPKPSSVKSLTETETLESNETFFLVEAFMPPFREKQSDRLVEKTVLIPYWLNVEAKRRGINLSHTLQTAVKRQLHIAN